LSEITYFYDLAKPSAFGVQRQALLYTRIQNTKIYKLGLSQEKRKEKDPQLWSN